MKSSISILIVDDEQMMRDLLKKILSREGYQIHTAEDGVIAVECLKNNNIDIVISDMKIPRMDGFELLSYIKKEYPRTGVINKTGSAEIYTVKDTLLLGADEYITKPFKSFEISLVIERAYWRILSASNRASKEPS